MAALNKVRAEAADKARLEASSDSFSKALIRNKMGTL